MYNIIIWSARALHGHSAQAAVHAYSICAAVHAQTH